MTTDLVESVLVLPDTLAEWPYKRNIHPLCHQAEEEATAWFLSLGPFTPRMQRLFNIGNHHLLSSLVYPLENKDVFRVGCDLMNWFFLFDDYSDLATPQEAQQMADIVMDAIRNPEKARPAGEWIMGEATRQFWELSSKCASAGAQRRFIQLLDRYTFAVVQEARDRAQNFRRSVDEYFAIRRGTIGASPSFVVLEFSLNLPDEVFSDPVIQRLSTVCVDLIILSNDICSYNVEQARGDSGHNLVTVLMHHENLDLNGAMRWIGNHASKLVHDFLEDLNRVPSFGEEFQDDLDRYLYGMSNWVRGNDSWGFESGRYFLTGGGEIQKSRKVFLLPRVENPAK